MKRISYDIDGLPAYDAVFTPEQATRIEQRYAAALRARRAEEHEYLQRMTQAALDGAFGVEARRVAEQSGVTPSSSRQELDRLRRALRACRD